MRDYVVVMIVFGSLPLILRKPFFGILVWTWLSMMSPHRLCWSFAYNLPLAQIVAITLIGSFLISKEPKRLPAMSVTWLLGFWWFWWFVTTLTAFYPADAWEDWNRAWKIFLLTFLMFYMLTSRPRVDALVWVIVASLGYFGVKGGAFTLVGGGSNHVLGPPGSFISGNTEIGLALVMTVPLMRYLQLASNNKWVKIGMIIAMGLTMIAILGTQSRGALLGLLAMTFYLALKSRNKAGMIMLLLLALPVGFLIMPESWYSRMDTIQTYDQDASSLGRINAWWVAWNVALDHPILGGGANMFTPQTFAMYAPDPTRFHDVHSIYFEALGEHGFVGFFTFVGMMLSAWFTLNRVIKFGKRHPELTWMRDLASMVYVSIIGYAASGAFLGLSSFDFFYTLLALTVGLAAIMRRYEIEGIPVPMTVSATTVESSTKPRDSRKPQAPGQKKGPLFGVDVAGWFARL